MKIKKNILLLALIPSLLWAKDTVIVVGGIQHEALVPVPTIEEGYYLSNSYLDLGMRWDHNTDNQAGFRGLEVITRAELTEVLTSEFMLLARTKGLTRAQATVRHAMKNCMVVILPSIFGEFIGIMSGSLIIESIFGVPGVGGLSLDAINGSDYPMFTMVTVFYTVIGLAASIVVDISYGFIDPRIRMGSRK